MDSRCPLSDLTNTPPTSRGVRKRTITEAGLHHDLDITGREYADENSPCTNTDPGSTGLLFSHENTPDPGERKRSKSSQRCACLMKKGPRLMTDAERIIIVRRLKYLRH
ncbi:hypothetical protein PVAP13_1KG366500 [Panicum virgatum]|uniref:Uncharacterized protein n=1 Tax=Panicum virgatum TaxID=38727 RepID=A0A8T0XN91_PANVG|nr:hypothetical protein PVAP13_1KG366500 [Panicum virgatum]KAG2659517.1 hypothetical protein PVAP13_1KG366500 [Panicum virgatum]